MKNDHTTQQIKLLYNGCMEKLKASLLRRQFISKLFLKIHGQYQISTNFSSRVTYFLSRKGHEGRNLNAEVLRKVNGKFLIRDLKN